MSLPLIYASGTQALIMVTALLMESPCDGFITGFLSRHPKWWIYHHSIHDDVIKWKNFPRNWPFVREIHRSPVNFPHKGQWRGALMFTLINAWINDWLNNREAGDLRRQHGHFDVIVMSPASLSACDSEINNESWVVLCKPYAKYFIDVFAL